MDEEFEGLGVDYRDRVANKMMDGDPEYGVDKDPELREIAARFAHTRTPSVEFWGECTCGGIVDADLRDSVRDG